MKNYTIYVFPESRSDDVTIKDIEATDDLDALANAENLLDGVSLVEIWHEGQRIATLTPTGEAPFLQHPPTRPDRQTPKGG